MGVQKDSGKECGKNRKLMCKIKKRPPTGGLIKINMNLMGFNLYVFISKSK